MFYIRSSELIHLIAESLHTFYQTLPISPTPHTLATNIVEKKYNLLEPTYLIEFFW